jgi:hypothetical protein
MSRFFCWLLGHDHMAHGRARRSCNRCGQVETLRHFGVLLAWQEEAAVAARRPQE